MNKKAQRQFILNKSNGRCWYCGCDLSKQRWHEDHFYPVVRVDKKMLYPELDTLDNKVPSCASCNKFKSSMSIEGYRALVSQQFNSVPEYNSGMRQLIRLGLVDMTPKPVRFWFEKSGLIVPSEHDICGLSENALAIEWQVDKSEPEYYFARFEDFICTLRRMSDYYLVIAIKFDWEEIGRIELPNGRLAKTQAANWAINLTFN